MHNQSKERKMSKSQQQQQQKKFKKKLKKKKKLTRAFPFGLARFRFNEVRINEVPLYRAFHRGAHRAKVDLGKTKKEHNSESYWQPLLN